MSFEAHRLLLSALDACFACAAPMRFRARVVFHAAALVHHALAACGMLMLERDEIRKLDSGYLVDYHVLYFSGWNFVFQIIFLLLALFCDVMKIMMKNKPKEGDFYKLMANVARGRDFFFTTFVFPFTLFVSNAFWVCFLTNRDLIMPEEWDALVSPFFNHALHTQVVLIIVMELIVSTKEISSNHMSRLGWIAGVTFFYYACFIGARVVYGQWIYLLFETLSWQEVTLLLTTCYLSANVFYFMGYYGNHVIGKMWSKKQKEEKKNGIHKQTVHINNNTIVKNFNKND